MVRITISALTPSTVPTDGWVIRYRIKGTAGAYTTVGPFTSLPIIFSTTDPAGTLYEGFIKRDCGALESSEFAFTTPCDCTEVGYNPDITGNQCEINQTVAPTISHSGYCLAPSVYNIYTQFETRVYLATLIDADIHLPPGSVGGNIVGSSTATPQWCNPSGSTLDGPMNREGVWIDSDCDGSKDPLAVGVQTTLSVTYNNITGSPKPLYVGIGADNNFHLLVNGVSIVDSATLFSSMPFKIFHVIPIIVPPGLNYINIIATGDGSINDSLAVAVYDNTSTEILSATSDITLNVVFKSSSLRGSTYDVTTCPSGYSLDSSGGSGSYICRRKLTMACNTA